MSQELEMVLKSVAVLVGLVGAAKVIYELALGSHGRRREEYKFAKDFFQALKEDPSMHPFLKEKGYQAVAGNRYVSADEIEYVLSLQTPNQALRDYTLGRMYLDYSPRKNGDLKLEFRSKYKKAWSRIWLKTYYTACYALLGLLAISPFLVSGFLKKGFLETLTELGVLFVLCGPLAWFALMSATRVYRAEKLVKNQSKHTQKIAWKNLDSSR